MVLGILGLSGGRFYESYLFFDWKRIIPIIHIIKNPYQRVSSSLTVGIISYNSLEKILNTNNKINVF
jgi:hypothetical protein